MAHQLEMVNGNASAFFVGQTPWHKLGTMLDSPPTMEEGILAAGLDWRVGLKNLVTTDGEKVDHRATYRMSDGKIFGVVGPGYTPLQNADAFKWFQPILDSGLASLHTAGSLQEGRKIWILAKINKPNLEIVDGDSIERFILLSNAHDGTRAVRVGFTPIRVVCANTLQLAHDATSEANKLIKVSHTKNVKQAIEAFHEVMNVANSTFEASAEQFRKLAKFKINHADLRKYVKLVLDIDPTKPETELPGQTLTKIRTMTMLASHGKGNSLPGVMGTMWAAYNGVTEYLSYEAGRTDDNRLDSLWFGQNANLSRRALEIAVGMAA